MSNIPNAAGLTPSDWADEPFDLDADWQSDRCQCPECQAADAEEERWTLTEEGIAHEDDILIDLDALRRASEARPRPAA